MRNAWKEFKNFAMGGNMIDLAIGIIIGLAFAAVVQSLADDLVGGLIGAIVGKPDLSALTWKIGKGEIGYGSFLTALLNFLIIAAALFGIVKLLMRTGMGNFRAQGSRECPYCREFVAVDAVRCKWCTSKLRAYIDEDEGAEERVD